MRVYFDTNKGLLRENNEDNLLVNEAKYYSLYAVADGMGGHSAGEVASMIALNAIKDCFEKSEKDEKFKVPKFINESIQEANIIIREEASKNIEYTGMGTTVTMAVIDLSLNIAYIGNIGDSRTYILKSDAIKQITEDHTYVHELYREGKITVDEAKKHPKRNVITRAVGSEEIMQVDIFEIELEENDIILLCSDGLTTHLSDEIIFSTIKKYGCEKSVEKLIELSNDSGGTDNITLIIVDTNKEVRK
ncbi:MAG: protein serine/threonine phosphatase [Bacillota bacterium]|jgi:protein phosphatase|nr:protein serine/threonine phosphatase [Bacillota bacterium]